MSIYIKILTLAAGFLAWKLAGYPMWKTRNKWVSLLTMTSMPDRLPYWAWKFGGGPVPVLSFRIILVLILFLPWLVFKLLGFTINWNYPVCFTAGFLLAEILDGWLQRLYIGSWLGDVTKKNPSLFDGFLESNRRNNKKPKKP